MNLNNNEQARKWLRKHAHELEPEELSSEEEKANVIDGKWPVPKIVQDIGIFSEACSQKGFNKVVGDPSNWDRILSYRDLYKEWILPNAIILFGKSWFDRVKWKSSINRGIPFPLFTRDEKELCSNNGISLEDIPSGRAAIAKIVEKTSYALGVYLKADWYDGSDSIKNPGGYIIDSIKNEFSREIGADLGFKLRTAPACPYCLSFRDIKSKRTPLVYHGSYMYSCPKCEELYRNIDLINGESHRYNEDSVKTFIRFIGVTCVCPSDSCNGKFVPISSLSIGCHESISDVYKCISEYCMPKNIRSFHKPPKELKHLPLVCPYCDTHFTPNDALRLSSGFNNRSGYFTGLPTINIWQSKEKTILDSEDDNTLTKNSLARKNVDIENQIEVEQRISILIDELTIKMAETDTDSVSGLISWFFYYAAIKWMMIYTEDAAGYFFGWRIRERNMTEKEMIKYPGETKKKVTDVVRGKEIAIHQSFFHTWMNLINNNLNKFSELDPEICSLGDFKWFCSKPKFSNGPESTFISTVSSRGKILNTTEIIPFVAVTHKPRIGRVISIFKVVNNIVDESYNYINDIYVCEWQAIRIKSTSALNEGDKVQVRSLIMSGHPGHAPMQRILRLRTTVLGPIINKILNEEKNEKRDFQYWKERSYKLEKAKEKVSLK